MNNIFEIGLWVLKQKFTNVQNLKNELISKKYEGKILAVFTETHDNIWGVG
jgi:hypothetical protein